MKNIADYIETLLLSSILILIILFPLTGPIGIIGLAEKREEDESYNKYFIAYTLFQIVWIGFLIYLLSVNS